MTERKGRPLGRPRTKPVQEKQTYLVTTFRMKMETVAEVEVIKEVLALGSRTNALQYAVRFLFERLEKRSAGTTRRRLDARARELVARYRSGQASPS
jgi:hypothetical protein